MHQHTSYGPLKRALVKVDREEVLHLRHGESWMKRLAKAGGEARAALQRAVDWMFPMTLEWFGLPDTLKHHGGQLAYRLKGKTNDQLRQKFVDATIPQAEILGVTVPDPALKWNPERDAYDFGEIDWAEFWRVVGGEGPCNRERLAARNKAWDDGAWVRDAALAHARKQAMKAQAA